MQPIPWFVAPLLFLTGLVIIGIAIPLVLRRVKPNPLYGFRVPATFADEVVWYEMNARAGRHMIVIGVTYITLLAGLLAIRSRAGGDFLLVAPMAFLVVALIVDALVLTVAANRMLERRRRGDG